MTCIFRRVSPAGLVLFLLASAWSIGASASEQDLPAAVVADIRAEIEAPRLRINVGRGGSYDVSEDGRIIAYVVSRADTARNQVTIEIWLRGPNGARAIHSFPPVTTPKTVLVKVAPDGNAVAWIDPDDTRSITIFDVGTGRTRRLVPALPDSSSAIRLTSLAWQPAGAGARLAVVYAQPLPLPEHQDAYAVGPEWEPYWDTIPSAVTRLAIIDQQSGSVIAQTSGRTTITDFDWSPDGARLAFSGSVVDGGDPVLRDTLNQDIYVFDVASGREERLTDAPGPDTSPRWSLDGGALAYLTTTDGDIYLPKQLAIFDLRSRRITRLGAGWSRSPAGAPTWINNQALVVSAYADLGCALFVVPVDGSGPRTLRSDSMACLGEPIRPRRSSAVYFTNQSFSHGGQIWALDGDDGPVLVCDPGEQRSAPPANISVVRWYSGDRRLGQFEGVLLTPSGTPARRLPLVVAIVGGPSPITPIGYDADAQIPVGSLVAQGYAVFVPYTRGRAGGTAMQVRAMRDAADYLPGPYEDVMTGIDHLVREGIADPSRLAIVGHSYGAHLAVYVLTRTRRFRAAVLSDPISVNFMTSFGNGPSNAMIERNLMGLGDIYTDQGRRDRERNSTAPHLDRVRTPVLLRCGFLSGAHAAACPTIERALTRTDTPVRYLILPRTSHVIEESRLRLQSNLETLRWLNRWLR